MAEDTVKKVIVPYIVDDTRALGPLGRIAHGAEGAGRATEGLKDKFKEFRGESVAMAAGVLGLGFGFAALAEKMGESNREFMGTQKAIAATMTTILDWPKTMAPIEKFTRSMTLSKNVTRELDETAGKFNMGLRDMGGLYKTVGIAAGPLHMSQKQWMEMTVKSAAVAKALGADAGQAGDLIGKLLMGKNIRLAGDLGKILSNEVGKNLGKLHGQARFEKMSQELEKFIPVAEQMGKGFDGAVNRIQLKVNEMVRDLTGPLFSAIGGSLDGFAQRLNSLGEGGKPLIETYANRLVEAFHVMATTTTFLLDHWKQIAAVWAGMKVAGGVSGLAGSLKGGGAGGLLGAVKGSGIPIAGAAAGLIAETYFENKARQDEQREKLASMAGVFKDLADIQSLKERMGDLPMSDRVKSGGEAGAINRDVVDRMQAIADKLQGMGVGDSDEYVKRRGGLAGAAAALSDKDVASAIGMNRAAVDKLSSLLDAIVYKKDLLSWSKAPSASETDANRKATGKPQVLFTGENHFEFKWEDVDPDRAMLRFHDDMENYTERRTSSVLSDPLGD